MASLGVHNAGETLVLRVTPKGKDLYYVQGEPTVAMIDQTAFEAAFARLASDQLVIGTYTESSFDGKLTTSRRNELVLTTLAYDQGWKITVDGKEAEVIKALGSLVAFRVDGDAGEHDIQMVYRPRTLVLGLWVSGISTLIFLALVALSPLMRKVPGLRGIVSTVPRKKREDEESEEDEEPAAAAQPAAVKTGKSVSHGVALGLGAVGGTALYLITSLFGSKKTDPKDDKKE